MIAGAMQHYVCHKRVRAIPMTRQAYNDLRQWVLPANETGKGEDEGYLVEYQDGGPTNHPDFAGYISWSPKDVFEKGYVPHSTTGLTFGQAIDALKQGHRVTRAGWNGKDMWLSLTPGSTVPAEKFWSPHNRAFAERNGGQAEVQPYITMKTAQGKVVPWLASQSDMLDNDWSII